MKLIKDFLLKRELKKNRHKIRVSLLNGEYTRNYYSNNSYQNDKKNYIGFLKKKGIEFFLVTKIKDNGKLIQYTITI